MLQNDDINYFFVHSYDFWSLHTMGYSPSLSLIVALIILVWFFVSLVFGIVIGKAIRISEEREAQRYARQNQGPEE